MAKENVGYARTTRHRLARESLRELLDKELSPVVAELDEESRFPMEVFKKMGALGFLGFIVPKEYGGVGVDYFGAAMVAEELAKISAGIFTSVQGHLFCSHWIDMFGSPDQKQKYLPLLGKGEYIGAIAMTEPDAGSDLASMRTSAHEDGDGFRLNGRKTFITNGPIADVVIVVAVTDEGVLPREMSLFIVETKTPGFRAEEAMKKLGNRSSPTSELAFNDCVIAKENLLGTKGEGFSETIKFLSFERVIVAVGCGAITESAMEAARKYAAKRVQFGRPIAHFQSIQNMLADMATDIYVTKCVAHMILDKMEKGEHPIAEAAMAKLFATDMVMRHTINAVQIFGGYGYLKEFPVERYFRDAKLFAIGGGTSQILRLIIAEDLLKKG